MALRYWLSLLCILAGLTAAGARAGAPPPAGPPLAAILQRTASIKLVDHDAAKRPGETIIKDRDTLRSISAALGGDPSGGSQRRCGDSVTLTFLDDKGVPMGRVGFCGTGGLYAEKSGEKPLSGAEFTALGGGRPGSVVPIRVADPAALLRLLRAALGGPSK